MGTSSRSWWSLSFALSMKSSISPATSFGFVEITVIYVFFVSYVPICCWRRQYLDFGLDVILVVWPIHYSVHRFIQRDNFSTHNDKRNSAQVQTALNTFWNDWNEVLNFQLLKMKKNWVIFSNEWMASRVTLAGEIQLNLNHQLESIRIDCTLISRPPGSSL